MDYENETRAPRLNAATWSLVAAAGIFLSLRLYCKRIRSTGLWWDDHFMIAAWITLVVAASLNTYITTLGFGRHYSTVSMENRITINRDTIIVAVFGSMSSCLSKTSFAATLYRLFQDKWTRSFLIFIVVTVTLFLNSIWVTGFLKCQPIEKVWDSRVPGSCWDKKQLVKWQLFASYYNSGVDFILALLPWKTLLGMTMPLREKIGVTVAMSMGMIAGATGIVKSVMVIQLVDPDITFSRIDLTIWTITEPAVTIMAASLPVLRVLGREIRSKQRSYYARGAASKPDNTRRNTLANQSRPQRKGNQVTVMSTTGWQESQEALQRDVEMGSVGPTKPPPVQGIIKTEEVRIQSWPNETTTTTDSRDSFEMVNYGKPRPEYY